MGPVSSSTIRQALFTLLIAQSRLYAQADGASWGPVVGLSRTTLTGVVSAEYRTGFTVGAQFRKPSRDERTFWQTGISYSTRGAAVPNLGADGSMVLKYVEVPLSTAWNIPIQNPWITPFVSVGAQLGIRLSCVVTGSTSSGPTSLNCDDPVFGPSKLAAYDLSLSGGGGATVEWGARRIQVDVRYLSGLRATMANTRSKNRGFTLAVGYMMQLHRTE